MKRMGVNYTMSINNNAYKNSGKFYKNDRSFGWGRMMNQ